MATAFDTLSYAKKLVDVGFTEKQAEVQAEAFNEMIIETLATKHDINGSEQLLRRDIIESELKLVNELRQETSRLANELRHEMAQLANELRQEMMRIAGELRAEIKSIETSLRADFQNLSFQVASIKFDIIKWVFTFSVAQSAILISAIKLLH